MKDYVYWIAWTREQRAKAMGYARHWASGTPMRSRAVAWARECNRWLVDDIQTLRRISR